jgi:hypothetical protein
MMQRRLVELSRQRSRELVLPCLHAAQGISDVAMSFMPEEQRPGGSADSTA